jgi:hypothetical protein
MSLNPDTVLATTRRVLEVEKRLTQTAKSAWKWTQWRSQKHERKSTKEKSAQ